MSVDLGQWARSSGSPLRICFTDWNYSLSEAIISVLRDGRDEVAA